MAREKVLVHPGSVDELPLTTAPPERKRPEHCRFWPSVYFWSLPLCMSSVNWPALGDSLKTQKFQYQSLFLCFLIADVLKYLWVFHGHQPAADPCFRNKAQFASSYQIKLWLSYSWAWVCPSQNAGMCVWERKREQKKTPGLLDAFSQRSHSHW